MSVILRRSPRLNKAAKVEPEPEPEPLPTILTIPREIRLLIYKFVFADAQIKFALSENVDYDKQCDWAYQNPYLSDILPDRTELNLYKRDINLKNAITKTCHFVRKESEPILRSSVNLLCYMENFLDGVRLSSHSSIPDDYLRRIKRLHIVFADMWEYWPWDGLLSLEHVLLECYSLTAPTYLEVTREDAIVWSESEHVEGLVQMVKGAWGPDRFPERSTITAKAMYDSNCFNLEQHNFDRTGRTFNVAIKDKIELLVSGPKCKTHRTARIPSFTFDWDTLKIIEGEAKLKKVLKDFVEKRVHGKETRETRGYKFSEHSWE